MKTGRKQEWQDLITETEKLWREWQFLVSNGFRKEKMDIWYDEMGSVLSIYRRLKNGNGFETLTKREQEIVDLICQGKTIEEIARILYITGHTVETHRGNIFSKLSVRNMQELILLAVRGGMVR